jgi:hypothetical protein
MAFFECVANNGTASGVEKISFTARFNDDIAYGSFYFDATKHSQLQFTLTKNGLTFPGGYFVKVYNSSGTEVQTLNTSDGVKTITLDSAWGTSARIVVYGHSTKEYASVLFSDFVFT